MKSSYEAPRPLQSPWGEGTTGTYLGCCLYRKGWGRNPATFLLGKKTGFLL